MASDQHGAEAPGSPATTMPARLPALDGVRGLAILLVMQFHFYGLLFGLGGQPPVTALDRFAERIPRVGWSGVDLFFVLSGFLITGILYDAKSSGRYFRNFYARRFLRIVPVYYGFLIFVLLVPSHVPALAPAAFVDNLREHQIWYWTYLVNVYGSVKPLHHSNIALVHSIFWSLAVEEQFYLVWPAVVLLCSRRALTLVCVAMIVGAFAFRFLLVSDMSPSWALPSAPYDLTPARMDSLAIGALIALAVRGGPGELDLLARWAPRVAFAAVAALAALWAWRGELNPIDDRILVYGLTAFAALYGALLATVLTRTSTWLPHRALSSGVLRFFGRYSYGMYVFHSLIAYELVFRVYGAQDALGVRLVRPVFGSQIPVNLAFLATATAATVLAAYGSWHLYEKHFLKLKRHFPRRSLQGLHETGPAGRKAERAPGPPG